MLQVQETHSLIYKLECSCHLCKHYADLYENKVQVGVKSTLTCYIIAMAAAGYSLTVFEFLFHSGAIKQYTYIRYISANYAVWITVKSRECNFHLVYISNDALI